MANHKLLIPFLEKWEGGWSDDPDDNGNKTMKGITLATYIIYCRIEGYPFPTAERLRNITPEIWEDIFKTMFWDRWKADEIDSQSIANFLVDWYWNSGIWGIKIPQRLLEVKQDGIVGPVTLNAVNSEDLETFFERIKDSRIQYVENIVRNNPSQSKFLKGWKNRINDLKFQIE